MGDAIKIRKLLKRDQVTISKMFSILIDKIDDKSIENIISSGVSETDKSESERTTEIVRIFIELFKKLFASLHDDVVAFFSDLIGCTVDEYYEKEIDIDITILNQIKDAPEVSNFFTGASLLFSATEYSKNMLKSLKGMLGSVLGDVLTK